METIRWAVDYARHLQDHLNELIQWSGTPAFYALMFLVIFCETGLVVTPILPGDSLLFALGALAATDGSPLSVTLLFVLLLIAAVAGDAVNYAIGWWLGPKVFKYEGSMFFNKQHLLRAQAFYEKYGSKTIILARFVPIVRTFAPFVAGIGVMRYPRFALYNVVGAVAWVALCLFGGYQFGSFKVVKDNFEIVLVAIVLISVLPMAFELGQGWWNRKKGPPDGVEEITHVATSTEHEPAEKV